MAPHKALLALLTVLLAPACSDPKPAASKTAGPVYDNAPIDASAFGTDATAAARTLFMPFGAAAQRLGSVAFESRTYFVFGRGGDEYEQNNTAKVRQDSQGNFHVLLDTGTSQVELYLKGEDVFVREDQGNLRQKARRDVRTDSWTDIAWSSIHQSLTLFAPQLRFGKAERETAVGRPALRYALQLVPEGEGIALDPQLAGGLAPLPVPPPARWREIKKPLSVTGNIWIDEATGVVLKVKLEGRLEIPDRDVRPTQLLVRYEGAVKDIGKVGVINVPKSVPEYVRTPPPVDPISFFRSELPPEEDPNATNTKK